MRNYHERNLDPETVEICNYKPIWLMGDERKDGMRIIGEVIRERREVMGLSRDQLANKTGIQKAAIIKYEESTTNPTSVSFLKMCRFLGLEISDFFTDEVYNGNCKKDGVN